MLPTPSLNWSPNLTMDMIVTAGGTPIPCNKSALVACSGYFSSQMGNNDTNNLDLPTVPADIFKSLLLYIYSGHLDVNSDNVYQIFWYSQMLQIPSAVLKCSQFISSKLIMSPNNTPSSSSSTSIPSVTTSSEAKTTVIKPIPRPGVPLLSLTNSYHQYLRPHLASFYSDWFLRYTTLTRNSFIQTENKTGAGASTSSNNDTKENEGN